VKLASSALPTSTSTLLARPIINTHRNFILPGTYHET
jgi:hypothetical protein